MQIGTKSRKLSINIGIDFGTCFSKVCFEESDGKQFVYDQNKSAYIPSIVYFDYVNKTFHYQKPGKISSIETIEYFKYSMIDESLSRSKYIPISNPRTKPEELCCVFFIACLINQTKEYVEKYYKKYGVLQFDWNITMGVPIDNYSNEFRSLYDIILHIAIKLSFSENLNKDSISLNDLDDFCQVNQKITIPSFKESPNNTLSELYAECIDFLEDKNVRVGLYAIVDIGGATVDMAVISKTQDELNKKKFEYGIISKSIEPLGIEILIHKIATSNDMYEKIRKLLKNDEFRSTNIEYNKIGEQELYQKMKEAFARLVIDAKDKFRKILVTSQKGKLPIILCGGGANYEWYKNCISSTKEQIRPTLADVSNGFGLEFNSVEKLKRNNKILEHRLIISSGLARPFEKIIPLDGFPWDFEKHVASVIDRKEISENILIENYGEIL